MDFDVYFKYNKKIKNDRVKIDYYRRVFIYIFIHRELYFYFCLGRRGFESEKKKEVEEKKKGKKSPFSR